MHLDQLPGSFFGPPNLVELLRHRALHQAQDQGFIYLPEGEDEQIDITYEELDRRARSVGAMLQSMKLQGERALLLYPAGLDFIAAFFGCLYAGVIAVPAYPPRRNRNMSRVEAIADDADARIALTVQGVLERVQVVINETPNLQRLQWLATDQFPDGIDEDWKQPDVHGDTLAFLQYTSGSTGSPKGVMLNHANLMHNSAMISYAFEHTRSGIGVFWLPSYHDMGLIGGILQPMYVGRPNVLFSPTNFLHKPFRWLKAITRFGGTVSGGPNFAYDLCVDKITEEQKATLDLSTWSLAFNGAEPIRGATIERFVESFEPCGFRREAFYPCYGLAEATLMVSGGFKSAPPVIRSFDAEALEKHQVAEAVSDDAAARELVGCGGNLLDQQITIVDPDTCVRCPDNQVGEIWVAGPSVASGYWRRPKETEQTFLARLKDSGEGPFLRTGDLGFILDGDLFVTGRLKDLIVIRGVNYYPQDIESSVENCHADLRAGAGAAFVDDRDGQERLVVVQEVARRRDLDYEGVFKQIRNCVATEHGLAVDAIVLIKAGSIPKTTSGKIQRHACRAGYLGRTLAAVAQWKASTDTEAHATAAATADRGKVAAKSREATEAGSPQTTGVPLAAERIAEIVFDAVRSVAKDRADNLTLDTNIVSLGLDSLERVEIVTALEETFGGRFPDEILPEMETCQQVVDAIQQYLGTEPARPRMQALEGEVPEEYFRLEKFPEIRRLEDSFRILDIVQVPNPFFQLHERVANDTTVIDGRELINYSSFNYLGMSGDPVVTQAAKQAINKYGTSVSASRLVSGEKPIHGELERAIADFIGVEDSIVFVAGHGTNETTIGHLMGPGDLILHDGLAHNSIVQGCLLSGARRRFFPHNDWQACDELLAELRPKYRRVLIVIEGVYSMDGDFPDLPRFIEVKDRHGALLMVDEAHSIGTMGTTGRGITEHFGVDPSGVDLLMGTLSKGLGSCGGYIAGCRSLVQYLKYTAPGFVYSTGLTPCNTAAALAALRLLEEEPERVARLAENAALFLKLAQREGLDTGQSRHTPVIPVILGSSEKSLLMSHRLQERGINVQPILHPAVEEKATRLRFFITSKHNDQQIRDTVASVAEELALIDAAPLMSGESPLPHRRKRVKAK